jgi:hypothetical protein
MTTGRINQVARPHGQASNGCHPCLAAKAEERLHPSQPSCFQRQHFFVMGHQRATLHKSDRQHPRPRANARCPRRFWPVRPLPKGNPANAMLSTRNDHRSHAMSALSWVQTSCIEGIIIQALVSSTGMQTVQLKGHITESRPHNNGGPPGSKMSKTTHAPT